MSVLRLWWLTPAVLGGLCLMAEAVCAQSITPAADGTGTQVTQEGNRYDVDGGTLSGDRHNLFHSFERLGLTSDEIANFLANPEIENILGRVTGGDASIIDGLIRVSGSDANLYLMNPAGIVFGPNARLDLTGSFTATTATGIGFDNGWFSTVGTNDYDALLGTPSSFAFNLEQPGVIANLGTLSVADGQNLALIGGTVVNIGTLEAPGGMITVAAVPGQNLVRLSQAGSLLSVEFEPLSGGPNAIAFTPATLPELLTGGDLTNATALTVDSNGTVRLGGSGTAIATTPGSTTISGTLTTAAPQTAVDSEIVVVGDRVSLMGATLNASGEGGGGTIRIGGDYQGQTTLPAASQTLVDGGTAIAADALNDGDGGRVIVWSENGTQFDGTLTARGGAMAGNGGFVEVSGRNGLLFDGAVDVSAPMGIMGTLLLDPANVVISAVGTDDAQLDDGQILATDSPGATFFITPARIVQLLNTGNVIITASNNITLNDSVSAAANTRVSDLTLTAPTLNINDSIILNGGALTFNGNTTIDNSTFQPAFVSSGGSVTFNGTLDRPVANGGVTVSANTIAFNNAVTGGVGAFSGLQLLGRNASFNSTGTTRLNNMNASLTGSLTLAGQNFNIQNSQIFARDNVNAQVQGLNVTGSEVDAGNLTVQAAVIDVNDTTLRSHQDLTLQSQTNLGIRNNLVGDNYLVAGRNLSLTAQASSLLIQDSAVDAVVMEAGNAIALRGGSDITINALNNTGSVFRSNNDITLTSNGTVTANGRFGAGGDFAVLDTLGNPRSFTTTNQTATGVISASGNVTFGDYTGVALWVEALGSIDAGNIVINAPNATLTGTAPEVALLSSTGSLILRAGVSQLSAPANLGAPLPLGGTTFTPTPSSGGNLSVGDITSGADGQIILSASGSVTTGDIFGAAGIDVTAGGNLRTGDLNTNVSGPTLDYGQVSLSSGGDITVASIFSGPGGVDINAAGSFQSLGYGTPLLAQSVPLRGNTNLINYLISQGVPANLFSDPSAIAEFIDIRTGNESGVFDPTRTDNASFPASILARPNGDVVTSSGFNAPVTIRYGGGGSTLVDNRFLVEGRPGRITVLGSGESFVTGPVVTASNPALIPNDPQNTFAAFDPNSPFSLRMNNLYGLQPNSALANASGTVGAIAVGAGSNINLYGSLQNNTFAPIPPNGGGNGGGGNGGGGNGGGGNGGNGGNGGGGIGSNGDGGSVALENANSAQFENDSSSSDCRVNPLPASGASETIALRSDDTVSSLCNTSPTEESLLQIEPGLVPQPIEGDNIQRP